MTMLNDDELYHFGVKGMKWGVRHARKRAQNRRDRDLDLTSRLSKSSAGSAKMYRDTANKLKKMSDNDYSKMFDDQAFLKRNGGAHKSRLDEIKTNTVYANEYANRAKQWAKVHQDIMNTSVDDYVKDRKIGKRMFMKMYSE